MTWCWSSGPVSRRAAVLHLRRCPGDPAPSDDEGSDPGPGRDRRAAPAQGAVHRAELPEPDRPDADRGAPGRDRRGRRPARVVIRGRPVRGTCVEGEPVPGSRPAPGRGPDGAARLLLQDVAPGLRLGSLRAPAALRPLVIVKQAADLHTSTLDQAAAARYLAVATGAVERFRAGYRERRDALVDALPRRCPKAAVEPSRGRDVHVGDAARGGHGRPAPRGDRHDVAYVPGAPFFAGPPADTMPAVVRDLSAGGDPRGAQQAAEGTGGRASARLSAGGRGLRREAASGGKSASGRPSPC